MSATVGLSLLDDPLMAAAVGLLPEQQQQQQQQQLWPGHPSAAHHQHQHQQQQQLLLLQQREQEALLQERREQQRLSGLLNGFSGQWLSMMRSLVLTRRQLLQLLLPVPLDLLHNPTNLFAPLPPLLSPVLLMEVAVRHQNPAAAAHLLAANLLLHRLADTIAIRALDPAQKRLAIASNIQKETKLTKGDTTRMQPQRTPQGKSTPGKQSKPIYIYIYMLLILLLLLLHLMRAVLVLLLLLVMWCCCDFRWCCYSLLLLLLLLLR